MTHVEIEDGLLGGLEQFIADRDQPPRDRMSYADAVNVIITDWLMAQGYLALPDDPSPIVPALEAADVPTD
jgi:hypothetical protein